VLILVMMILGVKIVDRRVGSCSLTKFLKVDQSFQIIQLFPQVKHFYGTMKTLAVLLRNSFNMKTDEFLIT
jgi:hypothetical protein